VETKNENRGNKVGGILLIGCMFLGLGIGKLYGNIGVGVLLGLGVGFLFLAAARMKNKD